MYGDKGEVFTDFQLGEHHCPRLGEETGVLSCIVCRDPSAWLTLWTKTTLVCGRLVLFGSGDLDNVNQGEKENKVGKSMKAGWTRDVWDHRG